MKLLIVTQAIDIDDPILGFFHRWVEEFSKRVASIKVICLKEGKHALPSNVRVHSLGKESASSFKLQASSFRKVMYAVRFLALVWELRKDYDTVLVHMNPEYVMLAGLFWKMSGKKIALWYNHPAAGLRLSIAASFADIIFFTSPYAATARYRKAKRMPAGIDLDIFKPVSVPRDRHLIHMQGRVMPSKRVEELCAALRILRTRIPATAVIVGPQDAAYVSRLRSEFADLLESSALVFAGAVPNHETPARFSAAGVAVNLAASGHFDKTVLEAAACGTPVVISSKAFDGLIPDEWTVPEHDAQALADALQRMMMLSANDFQALGETERQAVLKTQSLSALSNALFGALS